jgi:hypothetical protein
MCTSTLRAPVDVTLYTILGVEFVIHFSCGRPVRSKIISELPKNTGWIGVPSGITLILTGLAIAALFTIIWSIYRTIEFTDG